MSSHGQFLRPWLSNVSVSRMSSHGRCMQSANHGQRQGLRYCDHKLMASMTSRSLMQVSAFKDFTPGQGGGSAAPAAAASDEPAEEPAEEDEGEDEEVAESSGGGGDYPPHSVMGLPALSPTMSQGAAPPYCHRITMQLSL